MGLSGVVAFANQKGGVGKTTLACLYAWWLLAHGRSRVLVVDLDAQGNASRTLAAHRLGLRTASLFADAPIAPIAAGDGLSLVAADASLADVDAIASGPARFARSLSGLATGFDAVVIDTAPALSRRMVAALLAARHVVCPIELELYSIEGLTGMLKTIHAVRTRWNPQLRLAAIVANRFNHHSAAQRAALDALLARHGEHVLAARIAMRSAIAESVATGTPPWRIARSAAREAAGEVDRVFGLLQARIDDGDHEDTTVPACGGASSDA